MARRIRIGEKLLSIEGEEWIRMAARAAAVPGTLHDLRTLVANPRESLLSA